MGKPTDAQMHVGDAYLQFPSAPAQFTSSNWNTTLDALFKAAVTHAEGRINWYNDNASSKGRWAKLFRFAAIVLFSIGTAAPLIMALVIKFQRATSLRGTTGGEQVSDAARAAQAADIDWSLWPIAELGYVLLAMAGACVLIDQFFQFSVSWMRFRQSQAHLQVLLADFRYSWNIKLANWGGVIADGKAAAECVELLRNFVVEIELAAEVETKDWASQFNASVVAFDNTLDKKRGNAEGARAGEPAGGGPRTAVAQSALAGGVPAQPPPKTVRIRIAIEGADQLMDLTAKVDQTAVAIPPNGHVELPLDVGTPHVLSAEARRGNAKVQATQRLTLGANDEGKPVLLQLA